MSFGKMSARIEIREKRNLPDAEGFVHAVYKTVLSTRAYREGKHGSLRWANLSSFSDATDLFRFRTPPRIAITTEQELLCGDEVFRITSVENVKGRGMYTEILAKRIVRDNGEG